MNPSKIRLAIAAWLVGGIASAAPPRLSTEAELPNCPSDSDLRRAIADRLGRDDFDRPDAPSVTVRVRRTGSGLAAEVSVGNTTRTIEEGDTCDDLVRAAALVVALSIEEDVKIQKTPKAEKPPESPPEIAPAARIVPAGIRDDAVVMTASALTTLGLLPRPSPGVGLGARIRLTGATWLSAKGFWLSDAAMPNDTFSLGLVAAGAGACAEPIAGGSVAGVLCGHVYGGSYGVTDTNLPLKNEASKPYVGASLSAGARARIAGPLHLEGAVDAHVPFTRPTYLTDACPVTGFEPAFVALGLWLGAGLSID
jgi:hypothetical protein